MHLTLPIKSFESCWRNTAQPEKTQVSWPTDSTLYCARDTLAGGGNVQEAPITLRQETRRNPAVLHQAHRNPAVLDRGGSALGSASALSTAGGTPRWPPFAARRLRPASDARRALLATAPGCFLGQDAGAEADRSVRQLASSDRRAAGGFAGWPPDCLPGSIL